MPVQIEGSLIRIMCITHASYLITSLSSSSGTNFFNRATCLVRFIALYISSAPAFQCFKANLCNPLGE